MRPLCSRMGRVVPVLAFALGAAAPAAAAGDPPAFAPVSVSGTQTIALNVTCFEHAVGSETAPGPCRGEIMFHDAAGRSLKEGAYDLLPGQSVALRLTIPAVNASGLPITRMQIVPCVIPSEGRAIPSVEVYDREAARVVRFDHPASPRTSAFNNGAGGNEVGFDPQPDPPVFAMATLRGDQRLRMNLACFNHPVNGDAPGACTGTVMFHDLAGNVIRRGTYALEPGQSRAFEVVPPVQRPGSLSGIVPCILPDPASAAAPGRTVPNVEVVDQHGAVLLSINPAGARASLFERLPPVR